MKKYSLKYFSQIMLTAAILFVSASSIYAQNAFRKVSDFDGDGRTDFAVTRSENDLKVWYVWQSSAGFRVFQWGVFTDQMAAGDYDGDGKTDFAVLRATLGANSSYDFTFHVNPSTTNSHLQSTYNVSGGGQLGFAAFPQDFDGDGKTDLSLYLSTLFSGSVVLTESSTNSIKNFTPSGAALPIRTGDLTGDGKADFVSVNSSSHEVRITDYATNGVRSLRFGLAGDIFVPADFDGDGTGDVNIWRESDGNWWTLRSSDGTVQVVKWGSIGDIPVPGDYDGDGKTDQAIWRKGSPQSYYWVYGSQGSVQVFPFGISTDAPVRY